MDNPNDIQTALFALIKSKLPSHVSFIHEIADNLKLSYDSAYRRVRGEKALSLDELSVLCSAYQISVDSLLNIKSNNVVFNYHSIDPETFNVMHWLQTILYDIKRINACSEKEIIYAAKDPPFFHYFQFPEIAAFKLFFWQKTLFQFPEFEDKLLRLDETDPEIQTLGNQVLSYSTKVPTIEIWNEDTFNIMLRQIEYYWISGYFSKKDDVLNLCDKMDKWIRHIQKQAELGFKYLYGSEPEGIENSFQLYENEVVLNDNTIFVKSDDKTTVYLTYNVLSLLITQSPFFCDHVGNYLKGLIRKSNLISHTGAKERNRFFNKLLFTVGQFREKLS